MPHCELTDAQLRDTWQRLAATDWGSFDAAMKLTLRMAHVRMHARLHARGVQITRPAPNRTPGEDMTLQTDPAVEPGPEATANPLRAYMAWAGERKYGAVLVFAHTAQAARRIAYPAIADWTDGGIRDVQVKRLTQHVDYLDTLKLVDRPHVNDNPPTCAVCDLWGSPPHPGMNGCQHCSSAAAMPASSTPASTP